MKCPKFCENCLHVRYDGFDRICEAPQNRWRMPVTGKPATKFGSLEPFDCRWLRAHGWLLTRLWRVCGRAARWYEPRETKP